MILSDEESSDLNLSKNQYSKTIDITGLIAMPRKSSYVRDLDINSFGLAVLCTLF